MLSLDGHSRTICFSPRTRRRIRLVSKVSCPTVYQYPNPPDFNDQSLEAALDANAPIEDDDEANAGPVDSDEEYNSVMSALKNWTRNLQPVVPQPQLNFLKREVQVARLRQQLDAATDNGRKNIFKVSGYGAQRLPPGHPGHRPPVPMLPAMDQEDAPGEEEDVPLIGTGARSAKFAPITQQRQVLSVGGPA